jgi:AbrB family looped-hinge helix DNA binding protein
MRRRADPAGRIVIPKPIRDELGLRPGEELEMSARDGRIEIERAPSPMALAERDGSLAAEAHGAEIPPLTVDQVREEIERVRR